MWSEVGISGEEVFVLCEVDHVLSLANLLSARATATMPVWLFSGSALILSDHHTATNTIKKIRGKDCFGQIYRVSQWADAISGTSASEWDFWCAGQGRSESWLVNVSFSS